MHQVEEEEEKIEEQITVTEVVIESKKEDTTEEEDKKTIVETQIKAFKKRQELNTKIEEVRQCKSGTNKKASRKTKKKEESALASNA